MLLSSLIFDLLLWVQNLLYMGVGVAGLVGAVLVALTRDDAFPAAGRQPKMVWLAILSISAIVLLVPFFGMSLFTWVGAVVVGVYWFDVRPQIKAIVNGRW